MFNSNSYDDAAHLLTTALKKIAEQGSADSDFSKMIGYRYFPIISAIQKLDDQQFEVATETISTSSFELPHTAEKISSSSLALAIAVVGLNQTDIDKTEHINKFIYLLTHYPAISDADELKRCLETSKPWIRMSDAVEEDIGLGLDKSHNSFEGRIKAIRSHKKTAFIDIISHDAIEQLMIDREKFPEIDKQLHVGNYIQVTGTRGKTQRGADCILVESVAGLLHSQSLHSDAIVGEWVASSKKFDTFNKVRKFFTEDGYTEVRTPVITNNFQGGLSRPFMTFENARGSFGFLKVTSEIDMLKMVAGGAKRIFEFTTSFRNEGLRGRSSVEFPFFECYSTEQTLPQMCDTMTELISELSGTKISPEYIDFSTAFKEAAGFDHTDRAKCEDWLIQNGVKIDFCRSSHDRIMERMLESCVQPQLSELTFLKSMPMAGSPLIKGEGASAERTWVMFRGHEIAEIAKNETNHNVLREKLLSQFETSSNHLPRDYRPFLDHVAMGLPETVGVGLGLDRLHECLTKDYG